jgi:hypothetical protein
MVQQGEEACEQQVYGWDAPSVNVCMKVKERGVCCVSLCNSAGGESLEGVIGASLVHHTQNSSWTLARPWQHTLHGRRHTNRGYV